MTDLMKQLGEAVDAAREDRKRRHAEAVDIVARRRLNRMIDDWQSMYYGSDLTDDQADEVAARMREIAGDRPDQAAVDAAYELLGRTT
jgi:predicted component of type VI protein secretion system